MNESESTTCPYCGDAIPPRRRKHCGQLACKRAFNRERANRFTAAHPGYYSKYTSNADCYEHVCPVCGKTFKNHKDKPCHCSVECWQRRGMQVVLHPDPAPRSLLHPRHPAMTWSPSSSGRVWVMGWCKRCEDAFVIVDQLAAHYCSIACQRRMGKSVRRAMEKDIEHAPYCDEHIFERDGYRCHICGRKTRTDVPKSHRLAPTIDHLVPVSDHGRDAPDNVACAHRICNCLRSNTGAAQLRLIA